MSDAFACVLCVYKQAKPLDTSAALLIHSHMPEAEYKTNGVSTKHMLALS